MRGLRVWAKRARQAKQAKRAKLAERRAQLAMIAAALGFASCGVWNVGAVATAQETASNGERALAVVAKEPEKCAVLLVGVDKYKTLTSLQYASSDVRALRDALVEIGFPFKSIRTLVSDGDYNDRPSREAILATLDEILAASGPESTVLIALSGHGFETENGDAAFCPEDVEAKQVGDKACVKSETAILIEDVAERLRRDDARFKLLIVDACREPASTEKGAKLAARSFAPIPEPNGVAFLQSCESQELSWEHSELKGGVFTHFFAKGMTGAADSDKDGGVSFLDVCNYATSQTQRFVRDKRGAEQTPFYRFSGVVDFWLKPPTGKPQPPVAVPSPSFGSGWLPLALLALTGGLVGAVCTFWVLGKIKVPGGNGDETQTTSDWSAEHEAGTRRALRIKEIEYVFRYCPPGTFIMGSPENEKERYDEETPHNVTLTNDFWILETPVTQAMWKSVAGENPSWFSPSGGGASQVARLDTSNFPVENVSWNDCQDFIEKLNSLGVAPKGFKFRLPTEAEWEYACRAGSNEAYSWGASLNGDKANCDGNYPYGTTVEGPSLKRTTAVDSYDANSWGARDMHGNVGEWCADLYDKNYYNELNNELNPINTTRGSARVLRGGSWYGVAESCRSAYRFHLEPTSRNNYCGLRLVLGRER